MRKTRKAETRRSQKPDNPGVKSTPGAPTSLFLSTPAPARIFREPRRRWEQGRPARVKTSPGQKRRESRCEGDTAHFALISATQSSMGYGPDLWFWGGRRRLCFSATSRGATNAQNEIKPSQKRREPAAKADTQGLPALLHFGQHARATIIR
jgi:hypothetical protein